MLGLIDRLILSEIDGLKLGLKLWLGLVLGLILSEILGLNEGLKLGPNDWLGD